VASTQQLVAVHVEVVLDITDMVVQQHCPNGLTQHIHSHTIIVFFAGGCWWLPNHTLSCHHSTRHR
jgi:hypothetical protein